MKVVIVTGVTGQDGYYLSKQLLQKGYQVIGYSRYQSHGLTERMKELISHQDFTFIDGDITDRYHIGNVLKIWKPDHFYNLAALSHVGNSYEIPERVTEVNYMGVLNILQEIRDKSPHTKFLQASTSELFGQNEQIPHNEETKMLPTSPYSIAKFGAYALTKLYRAYGLKTYNSICFNHESEYRPENFVTGKIAASVARIMTNQQEVLELGNMNAYRDWGYAPDYTKAMIMMMESDIPDDYVIATNETHSVREFVEQAVKTFNNAVIWENQGVEEVGKVNGIVRVKINPDFYRPTEVPKLCGDYSKIKQNLGWEPKIRFEQLVQIMVEHHYKKEVDKLR